MIPEDRSYSDVKSPPAFEYHIKCSVNEWSILTVSPKTTSYFLMKRSFYIC